MLMEEDAVVTLPIRLVRERYFTSPAAQSPFVRSSSLFEDVVIRCVRYAFMYIPAGVGRVFFSKAVALPFLRWRLLRHGYFKSPVVWREYAAGEVCIDKSSVNLVVNLSKGNDSFKGVWVTHKSHQTPDIVLYYIHGGGFSMGSSYFYLEFLLVWHQMLLEAGFQNPAIFSLEYTLVPDDIYPKQVLQALAGYRHVLDVAKDSGRLHMAGDSAGGCLALSLLQELGAHGKNQIKKGIQPAVRGGLVDPQTPALALPRMVTLISPWVTLMTKLHRPSSVDYLNRQVLWKYAHEYAGESMIHQHPASPGTCDDDGLWRASSPDRGYFVIYGEEEVFAPDIEAFLQHQEKLGVETVGNAIKDGVHAWPVASLFLSDTEDKRLDGLRTIVRAMKERSKGAAASGKAKR